MNLKNKTYMKNSEFKARQLWIAFEDAVGIALQVMEDVKERAWAWFKVWAKKPAKTKAQNTTLPLPFALYAVETITRRKHYANSYHY